MRELEVTHSLSEKDFIFVVAYLLSEGELKFFSSEPEKEEDVLKGIRVVLRLHGSSFISELREKPEMYAYTSKAKSIVDDFISTGSLPFDVRSGKVLFDSGEELSLPKVEFDVLRILADRSPNSVDEGILNDEIDYVHQFSKSDFEVTLADIRDKLDDYGSLVEKTDDGYRIVPQ